MPDARSIEVIINSHSGFSNNSQLEQRVAELFREAGVEVRVTVAGRSSQLAELATVAADRSEVIVAAGGDGTINSVASVVLAKKRVLGVLPLGTLNHFAKDLGIPIDLAEAVNTIVSGKTMAVDVGTVNDQIFLNNSSLGLYPSIVTERQKRQRLGHGKWPAFLWAAISVLRRYPFLGIRLKAAGKEITSRTPFVFLGNNQYEMEGFNIGGRKSMNAGVLSLYMSLRTGRWGLIRLAIRALIGHLRFEKDFVSVLTDQALVETKRRHLHVALDGEVRKMKTPLQYRVRAKALTVIIPERTED